QEKRELERPFSESWAAFRQDPRATRLLVTVALGTLGFSMQDIILEPYGGQILGLSVGATTLLTAMMTGGTLFGLAVAARALASGFDPHRLAGTGIMIGIVGFSLVIFASPFASAGLFRAGTVLVGLGGGLFAVSVLVAAMDLASKSDSGIALGAWGAVQATAAGVGLFLGGALRDILQRLAADGALGETLSTPITGYSVVYHLEILVLFASLVALGPLVRRNRDLTARHKPAFGLAQLPG
ncbi:MAG: PucC family protein, partial [Alsobacter sp.]